MAKLPPARVDLTWHGDRVVALKFWRADGRYTVDPRGSSELDLEHAERVIEWLETHNYTIRRWAGAPGIMPAGLRAWRGEPTPIRTTTQIKRLRARLDSELYRDLDPASTTISTIRAMDLALEG